MEKLFADLDTQIQVLNFTRRKSEGVVAKGNSEGAERQLNPLQTVVKRVEGLKDQVKQAKKDVIEWTHQQTSAEEDC